MADNKDVTINCPACGEEMEKVFMKEAGVYLDVCTKGCGGIYFDNREFKMFDEKHENISALETVLNGKEFKEVDESQTRICPVCGHKMVKNFSSTKFKIEVDECYICGGKFLDHKELDEIRAEYETEAGRAADAVKLSQELYGVAGPSGKSGSPMNRAFTSFVTKMINK